MGDFEDHPVPFAARVKDQAMFHLKHRARSKSQPNPYTDPPSLEVKSNRLAVLAVRSLPAAERLDANVAAVVEELARGTHRPPVQLKARQLHLDLVGDEGPVEITVNWHDCLDFARLLQKALPSCVEAIQLNQADVLYATPGWWELQASIAQATQDAMLSGTKPYLKACLGAATSLLHKEKRPKDKGASAAAPIQIVHQLAVRAAKAMGEDKAELVTQFDSLAEQGELQCSPSLPATAKTQVRPEN
ncbi:unnamed protein product [Effrenium voratum]|uniref:Uncharacterized protein n=1 Tax=Effrenium voratum TaxID=2562239 RepID=A0AA36MS87_9DINO|nr:unnamed protein product [Effrenium voratum]